MIRFLRLAFWLAMLGALVLASVPTPPHLPGDPSDKLQHVMAFLCLAGLVGWAYPKTSVLKLIVGLSAFGAFVEMVQLLLPLERDPELLDWVADTVAATVVLLGIHAWRLTQRARVAQRP